MKNLFVIATLLFAGIHAAAQRVGINTTNPQAMLHVKDSNVVFTGGGIPIGDDPNPPVTGPGQRMMWFPARAAFRVGNAAIKSWDRDSIGLFSFAAGDNPVAKGNAAIAMGKDVKARGTNSLALGFNTTASGEYSTALGRNTIASNFYSVAMGFNSSATGASSIVIGGDAIASGDFAMALGKETTASGTNSFATGNSTTAGGYYSTAMGKGTSAEGLASTAIGNGTVAGNDGSVAMGLNTISNGEYSTAMGRITTASGNYSVAMGFNSLASGTTSTAFGSLTTASANYSTAMGYGTNASGNMSTAMGFYSIASGLNSTATGLDNEAAASSSFVAGMYNDPIVNPQTPPSLTNPLFIIGNGSNSSSRNNAMVVLRNGNVGIGSNTPVVKLQIPGANDASYTTTAGLMVLGDVTGLNVVYDNNEILARNNGAVADLFLQNGGGNVGIGLSSASHQLHLSANDAAKPTSGTWTVASDGRLKKNVRDYTDGLKEVLKIHPVWFTYTGEANMPKETGVGVIAQELQQISPYMVNSWNYKDTAGNKTSYLSVDNGAMMYMLINAVKEQQKQIEELKVLVNELQRKLK